MSTRPEKTGIFCHRGLPAGVCVLWLLVACLVPKAAQAVGSWTPLKNKVAERISTILLLSDGTVIAENGLSTWYRLTPDTNGSYVNGAWSTIAPMHDTRLHFLTYVLPDGRVFVAGSEYGTGINTAEIYDPLADTWTPSPIPASVLDTSQPSPALPDLPQMLKYGGSELLPGGAVLMSPTGPKTYGGTLLYDYRINVWSAGPSLYRGGDQAEANWVKLPDDSILTVDPRSLNSERFLPGQNRWVDDAILPVALYDVYKYEIGPGVLLPDGRVMFFGSTGHTAFYTPSGTASAGSWVVGADLPNGGGTPDTPAAILVNGKVLCSIGPNGSVGGATQFPGPTSFYEYDPNVDSFTVVAPPPGFNPAMAPYYGRMLALPDGNVLFSSYDYQLWVYQPDGAPLISAKPRILSITRNQDGTYHLTGTLLNGISVGGYFGDDAQLDSNYPLVRLKDNAGNLRYARTFNWSSTSVMTGDRVASTEFSLPEDLSTTNATLVVVANGVSSDPLTFASQPEALEVSPLSGFTAQGRAGGPFDITNLVLTLTNTGAAPLTWAASSPAAWLDLSPLGGVLTASSPAASLRVTLSPAAYALPAGTFTAAVYITNGTDGSVHRLQFTLITVPLDTLLITPAGGFDAIGPVGGPFFPSSMSYVLTNTGAAPVDWVLAGASPWLTNSVGGSTLQPGGPAAELTISLNPTAGLLEAGYYRSTLTLSNLTSGVARIWPFTLTITAADHPLTVTGYNADVVVENSARGGDTAPYVTQAFDAVGGFGFYEAGLDANNISGGNPTLEGLPKINLFTNAADGVTTFRLAPFETNNVLYLNAALTGGTLFLANPVACDSLSILAASANGGGDGSLVIQFEDNSVSPPLPFSARDWLNNPGPALTHFGRIYLGTSFVFTTDNPTGNNPNLYYTGLSLVALGLNNRAVTAITFSMPAGLGVTADTATGVFAVSGTFSRYPIFQGAARVGQTLSLTWSALAARSYQLQANDDLLTGHWADLGNPIRTTGNTVTAFDLLNNAQRFYRIVLLP